MKDYFIFIILFLFITSLLGGCLEGNNNSNGDNNNNDNLTPSEVKEHLLGTWRWEGYGGYGGNYHQIGTWIFYENDTMESIFQGVLPNGALGAKNIVWWHYSINGSQLCFDNPSDPLITPGCYTYELLEEYMILRVTDPNGNSADWYKIE